jgi:hypothetical protein
MQTAVERWRQAKKPGEKNRPELGAGQGAVEGTLGDRAAVRRGKAGVGGLVRAPQCAEVSSVA